MKFPGSTLLQWVCFMALMHSLFFCKRESTDPQPDPNPANAGVVFKNTQVSNLTDTGAGIATDLELSSGAQLSEHGHCWSDSKTTPTIADSRTQLGAMSANTNLQSPITGLTKATTYHVRSYGVTNQGVVYGDVTSFTTTSSPTPTNPPSVETSEVNGATTSTLNAKGRIGNNGSSNVTEYGFVYAEGDLLPILNGANKQTASNRDGNGTFTATLQGLGVGKLFSVRAYATNATGTTYGDKLTGTTTNAPSNPPTVTTGDITNIGQTTAEIKGKITNNGSSNVTEYGVCWVQGDATPTVSNNKAAGNNLGSGEFASRLADLAPATTYSVRAYATNSAGTSYGAKKSFTTDRARPTVETVNFPTISYTTATVGSKITYNGSSVDNVTAWGVCYVQGSGTPTTADSKVNGGNRGADGTYTSSLAGLSAGTRYTVRAYIVYSTVTIYGENKTFTTDFVFGQANPPTVETTGVPIIGGDKASVTGKITNTGSSAITTYGVCWVQGDGTPTTANSKKAGNNLDNGHFSVVITGLDRLTKYSARAYATNSAGTSYGDKKTFTTLFL